MKPVACSFTASDGVVLSADSWGDPANPPVILSHGGGQTRHSWGATARNLAAQGWHALAYDHRGHGQSGWSPEGVYGLGLFAGDMKAIADKLDRKAHVVGASLGGFSALVSGGELDTDLFESITLVDVTPTLNREGVNHIFDFMKSNLEEGFENLDEVADVIAKFTGRPRRNDLSGLEKNLRQKDGRYYWHWDPDFFTLREDRQSNPNRVVDASRNISIPIMLIRGRMSDVVTELQVKEFLELVPHAEYIDVEHARHMVAGDKNDIFTEAVSDFLNRQ
jgi:pimeloyl-ACP methyl ester carboxylesterase